MKLPNGFLDELSDRVSIADVIGRKLSWDQKKSNPAKGEYWALCPFHQEKTPSFKVDDRKGFYFCFGCGSKGDAISFLRETGNMGFMEAVETLAREAGMEVPAASPAEREKADRRTVLADVMELAVAFYRVEMQTRRATAARSYLEGRGHGQDILDRFEIGFAPSGSGSLYRQLAKKGVEEADMVDAGLVSRSERGGQPYDRFRDRIMFPIRNPRGRCIAFGARAMDPNAPAKYLNSPETLLFDKGRTLYNYGPAREAAGKTGSLVVAEGYMDVIALVSAGITHAVAPLGTAITAAQLRLAWRISPEPVIALDGDQAGRRAALRLMDIAFPLVEAGKSLRFSMLPDGSDPDDMIREHGAEAMLDQLERSQPMADLLWQRETAGRSFDSPERRAALDAALNAAIGRIGDETIRKHYRDEFADRKRSLFGLSPGGRVSGKGAGPAAGRGYQPTAGTRSSPIVGSTRAGKAARWKKRESVLLAAAILNPEAAVSQESRLETCPVTTSGLREIHAKLLRVLARISSGSIGPEGLSKDLETELGFDPIGFLRRETGVRNHPFLSESADPAHVARTLEEELNVHLAETGMEREVRDAERDIVERADEGLTWRVRQARQDLDKALKTATAETSLEEEEKILSEQLQSYIDNQIWEKKKRVPETTRKS